MKYLKILTILSFFLLIFCTNIKAQQDVNITANIYDNLSLTYNEDVLRSHCENGSISSSGINFGQIDADNPVLCQLGVDVEDYLGSPYTLNMYVNQKLFNDFSDYLQWFNNNNVNGSIVPYNTPVIWDSNKHPIGTTDNDNTSWVGYSLSGKNVPTQFQSGVKFAGYNEGETVKISSYSSLNGIDPVNILTKIEVNPFQPIGNYSDMKITLTLLPTF